MAQSTTSGTSSRRYMREHDVPSSSRYVDSEWESKEALRQRELEEARARAAQMEKTMRWWSDCTANWREKWSKVRNERNMAREEVKVLRGKLEIAIKDASTFKHESQELELQNEQLKKEMEKIHMILLKHAGQFDQQLFTVLESDPQLRATLGLDEQLEFYNNVESTGILSTQRDLISCTNSLEATNVASETVAHILPDRDIEEYILQGAVPKHAVELYKESSSNSLDKNTKLAANKITIDATEKQQTLHNSMYDEETFAQKISTLQLKLEEATKVISVEREEKNSLHHTVEKLKAEIKQLREQHKELQESRTDAIRELFELKERFQIELNNTQADLISEITNGEGMDRRLNELRTELEKLQAENADEWTKRERLETEKIALERENKQLRLKIQNLQEGIESRRPRSISTVDTDTRQLQQELIVRNMVLHEVKQCQAILKQSLAEKTTELLHATRRTEQYEAEVKRVRARVEELKKELSAAQDEADIAMNSIRKLQRVNESLTEQLESANVELEHFRNSNSESCKTDTGLEEVEEKFQTNNSDESNKVYDGQKA